MSLLKNIFGKKESPVNSYADFWAWFQKNEKDFFAIVKNRKGNHELEKGFFDKLSPKLDQLKKGYFYLTGMFDDNTVELVLTADGNTRNIVFVEELVDAAPKIAGWKFTALKPALNIKDVSISMAGYEFNSKTMGFYSNDIAGYPDEVDITILHDDLTEDNKKQISNGAYIFLDNYIGELDFVNNIDEITVIGKQDAQEEIIPIDKLKDFLNWRQKEFLEKYEGTRYNTENDEYSLLEANLDKGGKLIALVNEELLNWNSKASHPWISVLIFKYDGKNDNGMPNDKDYKMLAKIEEEVMGELQDYDGYLNVGRQTANSEREIYFACKDFRKPSKVFFKIQQTYSDQFEIEYDIYKDKYWRSFERFHIK